MAHTRNWDNTDPANTDEAKYGAQEIREFKEDVKERLETLVEDIDDDPLGLAIPEVGADLAAVANKVRLYVKDVGGESTPYIRTSTAIYAPVYFVTGGTVKLPFYLDTAPLGWTIEDTLDDKLVFITKGSAAGGETGGGEHSGGSWTISGGAAASHTLTSGEIPSHTHVLAKDGSSISDLDVDEYVTRWSASGQYALKGTTDAPDVGKVAATGGGGGHTHTMSHDGTWRPSAYCHIICSKD